MRSLITLSILVASVAAISAAPQKFPLEDMKDCIVNTLKEAMDDVTTRWGKMEDTLTKMEAKIDAILDVGDNLDKLQALVLELEDALKNTKSIFHLPIDLFGKIAGAGINVAKSMTAAIQELSTLGADGLVTELKDLRNDIQKTVNSFWSCIRN